MAETKKTVKTEEKDKGVATTAKDFSNSYQGVAKSDGQTWNYRDNPGKVLEGTLINRSFYKKFGKDNNSIYTVKDAQGVIWKVFGCGSLDFQMKNLVIGQEIGIKYLGMVYSAKAGKDVHDFTVVFN